MKTANIEVTYINHCGDDLSVVNAARVSFHKESTYDWYDIDGRGPVDSPSPCGEYFNISKIKDGDAKLIRYLAKHKHFSPFNHAFLSFRVKAPIFVARQLVKHKFLPWNEVSRRYVDDEPEFYYPDIWRAKAENVKQGSSNNMFTGEFDFITTDFDGDDEPYVKTLTTVEDITEDIVHQCLSTYSAMIAAGICAEQARMILPQNTMTEWIWSGTLGAYCDMLRLRLDPHTQYESRLVAELIYEQVKQLFPVSVGALLEREVSPT